MTGPIDLDAYFRRIHYGGQTRPTLDTLAALLRAHMASIPFENLDVLLGRPVRLDLEGVQGKLVRAHRGGYCFEHGTLLASVLESLGFEPVRHTARVVLMMPRELSPRTHMFLTVPTAEGTFVADPGFGALAPNIPVPLVDATAHADRSTHWMVRDGDYWLLQAQTRDKVVDCWVTTLERDNLIDFELGSHYTATHRASPFVNRLMLRALTVDGRVTVLNRDLTIWRGGEPHASQLADRAALRRLLVDHFGFDLPEVEQLRVPSIAEWT